MKNFKGILIVALILIIFSITAASASDCNMTQDDVIMDDDVLSAEDVGDSTDNLEAGDLEEKSFDDIQKDIDDSDAGGTINLEGTYVSNGTAIVIDKDISIVGKNDAVLDANMSNVFSITSPANVFIKNLKIMNSFDTYKSGFTINCLNANLSISNCTFINASVIKACNVEKLTIFNCTFTETGDAINMVNVSNLIVSECIFNKSKKGMFYGDFSKIKLNNASGIVEKCSFEENPQDYLISFRYLSNLSICDCNFDNDKGYSAIYGYKSQNITISDCSFLNVKFYMLPVYLSNMDGISVKNCNFSNISSNAFAMNCHQWNNSIISCCNFYNMPGSLNCIDINNMSVIGCNFNENPQRPYYWEYIHFNGTNYSIINSTFENLNNAKIDNIMELYGSNATISACTFKNNMAGGKNGVVDIRADKSLVENSTFINNYDYYKVAIAWSASNGTIKRCTISNEKGSSMYPGGINSPNELNVEASPNAKFIFENDALTFKYNEVMRYASSQLVYTNGSAISGRYDLKLYNSSDFNQSSYFGELFVFNGEVYIKNIFKDMIGNYTFYAKIDSYTIGLENPIFNVKILPFATSIITDDKIDGEMGSEITLNVRVLDENSRQVSGIIYLYEGDELISQNAISGSDAVIKYSPAHEGVHNLTLKYKSGRRGYEDDCKNITLNITKKSVAFYSANFDSSAVILTVQLSSNGGIANKQVKFTIGNNTYYSNTDEYGVAKLNNTQLNLAEGEYNCTISFDGDNIYGPAVSSYSFAYHKDNGESQGGSSDSINPVIKEDSSKVVKTKPKLTASKKTFKSKVKVKKYTVTLKDNKNKPIKNAKITLKIKGKKYTAKTNSKGKATFKIKKLTKKGKYKAVIRFAGNSKFNAIQKSVRLTVKK